MFCPSCGARDQAPGSACGECGRALPGARPPAAAAPRGPALAEAPATVADKPARAPPTFADRGAPTTVADRPSAAPAEPPRILRRPAPLAPAPVDVVPRAAAPAPVPSPKPPPAPPPAHPSRPAGAAQQDIDPEGPTLIRRPPGFEERMVGDVVRMPPRRATPAAVEGVAPRAPAPPASMPEVPMASLPPVLTSAGTSVPEPTPPRATVPARPAQPRPVQPPPLPPPTAPAFVLPPEPPDAREPDTGSTAAVPQPALSLPPAVLVLGGGWRLGVARVVDLVLTAVMAAATLYASLLALGVRAAVQPVVDHAHADPVSTVVALVGAPFVTVALYQALSVLVLGATVGGRVAGLRVVRLKDGARPGALRAAVRGGAAALGTVAFGAGPLWGLLVDRRRRGLGDLVARCVTVRASAGGAS